MREDRRGPLRIIGVRFEDSLVALAPRNKRIPLSHPQSAQVICPSCQSVAGIFACDVGQITGIFPRVPYPHEGRFAIVTDVGCGMRWTLLVRETNAPTSGRRSRVVLTPRRWRQALRKYPLGDGGKKARSPGRARSKPLKPFARGKPDDTAVPVVD